MSDSPLFKIIRSTLPEYYDVKSVNDDKKEIIEVDDGEEIIIIKYEEIPNKLSMWRVNTGVRILIDLRHPNSIKKLKKVITERYKW